MPLKVELKPQERFILGTAVVTNGDQRATIYIEGDAPVLREKDIMTPEEAVSPASRIYLVVQMMYLDNDLKKYQDTYLELVRDFSEAAPSSHDILSRLNNKLLTNNLYKALKEARQLIAYEQELMSDVLSGGERVSADGTESGRPA